MTRLERPKSHQTYLRQVANENEGMLECLVDNIVGDRDKVKKLLQRLMTAETDAAFRLLKMRNQARQIVRMKQ